MKTRPVGFASGKNGNDDDNKSKPSVRNRRTSGTCQQLSFNVTLSVSELGCEKCFLESCLGLLDRTTAAIQPQRVHYNGRSSAQARTAYTPVVTSRKTFCYQTCFATDRVRTLYPSVNIPLSTIALRLSDNCAFCWTPRCSFALFPNSSWTSMTSFTSAALSTCLTRSSWLRRSSTQSEFD